MAKKKEKSEKKDAGAKPKTKAGPRAKAPSDAERLTAEIKELGAKLVAAANSPVGREVIAAGLTIAATAAAASRTRKKPTAAKAEDPAAAGGTTRSPDPEAIAATLGGIAETVLSKLFAKKA